MQFHTIVYHHDFEESYLTSQMPAAIFKGNLTDIYLKQIKCERDSTLGKAKVKLN